MYTKLIIIALIGCVSCFSTQAVVPMSLHRSHRAVSIPSSKTDLEKFRFGSIIISGLPMLLIAAISTTPAFAADIDAGKKIFDMNCAACHAHGQNVVLKDHTLEKEAIQTYLEGGFNEVAVAYQIRNGKGAMPPFGGRISKDDIDNVAAYVITTAEDGWE